MLICQDMLLAFIPPLNNFELKKLKSGDFEAEN
jgi:hypothetical protein